MLSGDFRRRIALEGEVPSHRMKQRRTKAVDVTPDIHRLSQKLLRANVLWRTHDLIVIIHGLAGGPGQTEVGKFGHAAGSHHDVVRLDVPVHQLLVLPGEVKGLGNLLNNTQRLFPGELRRLVQHVTKRLPLHVFHGKEIDALILTHGIGLHDIGVIQSGGSACFADEVNNELTVPGELLHQDFQGDRPVERKLMGEIDRPHATVPQRVADDEIIDHRPFRETRFRDDSDASAMAASDRPTTF